MGSIMSSIEAELELEDFVLTMIVLIPMERQGLKAPNNAVRSTAASAKALGAYVLAPKAP
jgi:hypothetical protein